MDSSGSLRSSSGGDEEYDSRTESMSAFFNSPTTGGNTSFRNLAQPPPMSYHQPATPFFDNLSYLDSNPNPFLNLDNPWARNPHPPPPSNPNCTNITTLLASSSATTEPYTGGAALNPPPPVQQSAPRNSKKRSRASRRAPTTVLTTDTSNFRAMVQEFTGIPAPPFASSSPFPRSRFDLFHSAAMRSPALNDTTPHYILRPFAQKVQPPSFGSSSPSTSSSNAINANPTTTSSYQLPSSDLGLANQHQTLVNIQSLLQFPLAPRYSLPTMTPMVATTSQAPVIPSEGNYGAGSSLGLPTLVASEGMHSKGSESRTTRSEGIVDSWICSSE